MLKTVEKMWNRMWKGVWGRCGKFCTFLTLLVKYCEMMLKTFGFTRSFGRIYTFVSTGNLFGFYGVRQGDLHIYT